MLSWISFFLPNLTFTCSHSQLVKFCKVFFAPLNDTMLAFFKVPVTSGALLVLLLGSLQVGCQASSSAKPTTAKTVATTSTTTTTTQASTEPTTISPNSEYASVQRCYHTLAEFNRIEECVSEAVKMHGGSLIINQTVILEGLPLVHKGASHAVSRLPFWVFWVLPKSHKLFRSLSLFLAMQYCVSVHQVRQHCRLPGV